MPAVGPLLLAVSRCCLGLPLPEWKRHGKEIQERSASGRRLFATLSKVERESLEALRTLIKETIPHVEERVSYGTTVMISLGRDLVGFVSQPKHVSFFMASPKLAQAMKDEITKADKVSGAPQSISHLGTRFPKGL